MSTSYTYDKLDQPEVVKHLFKPQAATTDQPDDCEEIMLTTADGCTLHLRAFASSMKDKPVILYFHDRNEQVADYTEIATAFIKNMGTSVLIAEYRGYGLATGTPSASSMLGDSQIIFEAALNWKKDNDFTGKFAIMGIGLGCAPAIEVVHNNPNQTDALLIDSGFTYTLPVLKAYGVDVDASKLTENDGFHHLAKIQQINQALYVIHMAKDDFIEMENASHLVSEAISTQKQLQIVPGKADDNQSILEVTGNMYFEVMNRFVKLIGIVRKKKVGVR